MYAFDKPFSQAAEENKAPILRVLQPLFAQVSRVLEIGSGSGQHGVHFAKAMPELTWQCSDVESNLPGIHQWVTDARLPNLPAPLSLDVNEDRWPADRFDAGYSANTAHIMSLPQVERMFLGLGRSLIMGSPFVLYGPFRQCGEHNSDSNARFDQMLRQRDPDSGVRDIEALEVFGWAAGLVLKDIIEMPVNNRILLWQRCEPVTID